MNAKELIPIIKNSSKIEIFKQKLNYKKIKQDLNWFPKYKLKNSIKITIDWYKSNLSFFNGKIN